jgi:hypothetical protein
MRRPESLSRDARRIHVSLTGLALGIAKLMHFEWSAPDLIRSIPVDRLALRIEEASLVHQ